MLHTDAFLRSAALAAGNTRARVDGPRFERPFSGVRVPRDSRVHDPASPETWLRTQCARFALRLKSGQYFSHGTALALYGVRVPTWERDVIHVSAHRPDQAPRTRGVIGHRLRAREVVVRSIYGVPVVHPAVAWVQVLGDWPYDDLVIAGDQLISPRRALATIEQLREEAVRARRLTRAETVIAEMREGSESVRETQLRLLITRAGLPEPQLAYELFGGQGEFIARLDQAYPELRLGIEYDGRQHAFDVIQFQRDADRWEAIRDAGWEIVRILNHHMQDDGRPALRLIRNALRRRAAGL